MESEKLTAKDVALILTVARLFKDQAVLLTPGNVHHFYNLALSDVIQHEKSPFATE